MFEQEIIQHAINQQEQKVDQQLAEQPIDWQLAEQSTEPTHNCNSLTYDYVLACIIELLNALPEVDKEAILRPATIINNASSWALLNAQHNADHTVYHLEYKPFWVPAGLLSLIGSIKVTARRPSHSHIITFSKF